MYSNGGHMIPVGMIRGIYVVHKQAWYKGKQKPTQCEPQCKHSDESNPWPFPPYSTPIVRPPKQTASGWLKYYPGLLIIKTTLTQLSWLHCPSAFENEEQQLETCHNCWGQQGRHRSVHVAIRAISVHFATTKWFWIGMWRTPPGTVYAKQQEAIIVHAREQNRLTRVCVCTGKPPSTAIGTLSLNQLEMSQWMP